MRDAASTDERWRGETGASGNAYRPLPCVLVLCAFTAPLLFLAGCSASTVDPRAGVAASPRVVAEAQPAAEAAAEAKPYEVAGAADKSPENYSGEGLASWYGSAFQGRLTANGEVFDMDALSAAHPTLPLPSYARVTNVNNGKSIVVRVNDRGPFHGGRALDVSRRVAEILDFKEKGMARVRIDYVGPASLKGSDHEKLMATYLDGTPAAVAVASLSGKPTTTAAPGEPALTPAIAANTPATPATPASRIDATFAGLASPQPLTRGGKMVEPVLGGFAFSPSTLGGLR